jgi:hypothetical protein
MYVLTLLLPLSPSMQCIMQSDSSCNMYS